MIKSTLDESPMNNKIITFELLQQFRDLTANEYILEYDA